MYKTVQINCFTKVFYVTAYPCVSTSVPLTYIRVSIRVSGLHLVIIWLSVQNIKVQSPAVHFHLGCDPQPWTACWTASDQSKHTAPKKSKLTADLYLICPDMRNDMRNYPGYSTTVLQHVANQSRHKLWSQDALYCSYASIAFLSHIAFLLSHFFFGKSFG